MSSRTSKKQTAEGTAFESKYPKAFGEMIAVARRLRYKDETAEVASEYAREIAFIGVMHDLTRNETLEYGKRIWLMVREEAQA